MTGAEAVQAAAERRLAVAVIATPVSTLDHLSDRNWALSVFEVEGQVRRLRNARRERRRRLEQIDRIVRRFDGGDE